MRVGWRKLIGKILVRREERILDRTKMRSDIKQFLDSSGSQGFKMIQRMRLGRTNSEDEVGKDGYRGWGWQGQLQRMWLARTDTEDEVGKDGYRGWGWLGRIHRMRLEKDGYRGWGWQGRIQRMRLDKFILEIWMF